jgi:hypothetical protein
MEQGDETCAYIPKFCKEGDLAIVQGRIKQSSFTATARRSTPSTPSRTSSRS